MRWFLLALTFASMLWLQVGNPTPASANPPTRDQIRALLSGYEFVPSTAQIRSLGPEALPILIELYNDPDQPVYVRLRSVASTAAFPTTATRTFLLAVARAPNQTDLMARQAVLALGQAFGERAITDVSPFLSHEQSAVREAAVRALSRINNTDARQRLRSRRGLERSAHIRREITRALAR